MKIDYVSGMKLPAGFVEEFYDVIDLNKLCTYAELPMEFIQKHFLDFNPNIILKYQKVTVDFVKEKWEWFDKQVVCQYCDVPIAFIKEKWADLKTAGSECIETMMKYQKIGQDFVQEKFDELQTFGKDVMKSVAQHVQMGEEFLQQKLADFDKNFISKYQTLTVNFIKDNIQKLDKAMLAAYQIIPDDIRQLLFLDAPVKTITGEQILALDPCAEGMARFHSHTPDDKTVLTWNELLEKHKPLSDLDIRWLVWKLQK